MKTIGTTALAVLASGALAGAVFAQTSGSPGGVNSGGPRSGSPYSGSPNPGSPRNEPGAPAQSTQQTYVPPLAPSASTGTTMNTGPDRALATPEDRARCASESGIAQADCMADARKQRDRGRM